MKKIARLALPVMATLLVSGSMPLASAAPKPSISAVDVAVVEGDNAVVTLTLSQASTDFVIAEYRTAGRSAKGDVDYLEGSGPVIFFPGQTQVQVQVPTLDDNLLEGNEVFTIRMHSAQATTPGGPVKITIVDND